MAISSQRENHADLDDSRYLNSIAKYRDKIWYQKLIDENPYLGSKIGEFSPSVLQSLLEGLGDTSARDNFYRNNASLREQTLSQLIAKYEEMEYNDPLAQKQRLSNAGINADLNGGIIESSSMPENDQPLSGALPGTEVDSSSVIGSLGSVILQGAFSVITGLGNINSLFLDNSLKSLSLNSSLSNSAWDIIKSGISENIDSFGDIEGGSDFGTLVNNVSKMFQDKIDRLPYSRHQKKMLHRIVDSLVFNTDDKYHREFSAEFDKLVREKQSEVFESRNRYVKSRSLPGAIHSDKATLDFISNKVFNELSDLQVEVAKLQLRNEKGYQIASEKLGLPGAKASAETTQFGFQSDIRKIQRRVTSTFESINRMLANEKSIDPMWRLALQAGLAGAESFALSKLIK